MNIFVPKNGNVQENYNDEDIQDDENIQNTVPEFKNTDIDFNPSKKQIQQMVFDGPAEKKKSKITDFNFLQDQYDIYGQRGDSNDMNYINVDDFRYENTDGNHKFMTEQSIQSYYRTILERISTQDQSFSKWQKESKKCQGIKFSADFRDLYDQLAVGSDHVLINKITSKFSNDKIRFDVLDQNSWKKPDTKSDINSDGLSLADKIIKFTCNLNQRSLTTILSTQFRLRGNSQFNIILRSYNLENEESCLLRFIKEGYGFDMRLFILLGRYDFEHQEYLFIKKCEVPLIKISEDNAVSDFLDVNCKIVDLGTDQLNLKAFVNGSIQDSFKIQYKQSILPIFDNFNIFMVGTGEDLAISRAFIEQIDRQNYYSNKNKTCTNSAKCNCNLLQGTFFG